MHKAFVITLEYISLPLGLILVKVVPDSLQTRPLWRERERVMVVVGTVGAKKLERGPARAGRDAQPACNDINRPRSSTVPFTRRIHPSRLQTYQPASSSAAVMSSSDGVDCGLNTMSTS
jgi:hypothetical protein